MEIKKERILNDLREKGFTEISFPISQLELQNAAANFLEFLKLPSELKEKIDIVVPYKDESGVAYKSYGNDPGAVYGYKKKIQKQGDLDNKEYFHYNEYLEPILEEMNSSDPKLNNFINDARKITKTCNEILKEILRELEKEYSGIYSQVFSDSELPKTTLRFLSYQSSDNDDFSAKGHYDKGIFTIAIAENAPGLYIGKDPEHMFEIIHKENSAILFPALSIQSVSDETLFPGWHYVNQKREDNVKESSTTRWAIVFFVNTLNITEEVTFEKAHTPK